MKYLVLGSLLMSIIFLTAGELHARIWTSTSNTRIDARLVEKSDDYVVLEKKDKSRVKVSLSVLSVQDRVYLRTAKVPSAPSEVEPVVSTTEPGAPVVPAEKPKLIEGELRNWTARDGTKLKARLAKQTAFLVVLQKEDGVFMKIPLNKFSDTDKKFLSRMKYKDLDKEPPPPDDYEFPIGKVHGPMTCKDDEKWSYYIYLPKNFNLSRQWPALFLMSPGGGKKRNLQRYTEGADLNGWVLIHSVEARNNFNNGHLAVNAMFKDALERLPIDEQRLYSSGFSGGARRAYSLAAGSKKKFAGVLPCGAGGLGCKLNSDTHIYGLVGSNCFNRWDMACTFEKYTEGQSVLWFFPGKHSWAEKSLITDGICWLNGKYLEENSKKSKELGAESYRFMKMLLARMESFVESDPERACRMVSEIDRMKVHPAFREEVDALQKKLQGLEVVKTYQKAEKDMRNLVKKYFETDVMDYKNNNCPDGLVKDASALAAKYPNLKLAATIKAMGGPAPM